MYVKILEKNNVHFGGVAPGPIKAESLDVLLHAPENNWASAMLEIMSSSLSSSVSEASSTPSVTILDEKAPVGRTKIR